jgi:hypothetical protein
MLWTFLRYGWGNTATIFALALLPIVNLLGAAIDHQSTGQMQAVIQQAMEPKVIAPITVTIDVAQRLSSGK